jgi:hypothetical protein
MGRDGLELHFWSSGKQAETFSDVAFLGEELQLLLQPAGR